MNVMLLAAGFGKRLRPLTDSRSKPSVPILGVPMIAYPLYQLKLFCRENGVSIDRLIVNLHYQPLSAVKVMFDFFGIEEELLASPFFKFTDADLFAIPSSQFSKHQDFAKSLVFSFESPKILDSAGGLKQAESFLQSGSDANFLVVNADSLFFADSSTYSNFFSAAKDSKKFGAHFLCSKFEYDHKVFGALWADSSNVIKAYGKSEGLDVSKLTPLHNVGFYLVAKEVLAKIPAGESRIFDVLKSMPEPSYGYLDQGVVWFETGDIKTFKQLCEDLESKMHTRGDWLGEQLSSAIEFWD